MKLKFIYLLLIIFIIVIFMNNNIVLISCIDAVNLWLYKVFPYLFIMFIINDLLIKLNFDNLFKNKAIYIFIMSLISGSPTSAFIISNLYEEKKIDYNTANNTLLFTFFANPLFLYSFLTHLFLLKIAIKIILINYLANIIIYFIFRKNININNFNVQNKIEFNISNSISKSMNTLLMILGTICLFMIISNLLTEIFDLNVYLSCILKAFLELTQGLNVLLSLNCLEIIKEILAISFISFGGLSIHLQVKCIIDKNRLTYGYFLKGRIYQLIISICLFILLYHI